MFLGLGREVLDLLFHTRDEPFVCVFQELILLKPHGVVAFSKISKQESELRELEKSFLGCSAVLVHWFSYNRKVNGRVFQVDVALVVSVAEDQHLEHVQVSEAHFGVDAVQLCHETRLVLLRELTDDHKDALVLLQALTLLEVRLENGFVVESHCAKARSFEVEIEFHVFFGPACTLLLLRWL